MSKKQRALLKEAEDKVENGFVDGRSTVSYNTGYVPEPMVKPIATVKLEKNA